MLVLTGMDESLALDAIQRIAARQAGTAQTGKVKDDNERRSTRSVELVKQAERSYIHSIFQLSEDSAKVIESYQLALLELEKKSRTLDELVQRFKL